MSRTVMYQCDVCGHCGGAQSNYVPADTVRATVGRGLFDVIDTGKEDICLACLENLKSAVVKAVAVALRMGGAA